MTSRLVDLRDGTRVDPGGGVQIVRSLVLHASGAVAWIANEYYSNEEKLWIRDVFGFREVDHAPSRPSSRTITSLRLTGSTVTWRHNGESRSATLY